MVISPAISSSPKSVAGRQRLSLCPTVQPAGSITRFSTLRSLTPSAMLTRLAREVLRRPIDEPTSASCAHHAAARCILPVDLKAAAGKTVPENVSKALASKQDLRDIEASDSLPGRDATYRFPSQIDNSYGGRRAVYSTFRRSGLLGSR